MSTPKRPAENALRLFSDLNENNVRYCHWKSNEHLLPALTGDTDLDILVDPADAPAAWELFAKNNFKRVVSHPWKRYSAVEDWIGLDEAQMLQTHLHVHYRLLTGLKNVKEQYFSFNEIVLANTVKHQDYDIRVCDPNIEVILLFIRSALKKSSMRPIQTAFSPDAMREYQYLRERTVEYEVARYARQMLPESTAAALVKLYGVPDDTGLFKTFRKELIRELAFLRRTGRARAECLYLLRALLYKASKALGAPIRLKKKSATGGKLISFIGVDGAGKTTLAPFFAKWLSWKIDCRYVYLGTGDGRSSLLNRAAKKLTGGKKSGSNPAKTEGNAEKNGGLSFQRRVRRTLANIVRLSNARYKHTAIKKMFRRVSAGEIVVTDRYPQMEFEGIYDGLTITDFPDGFLAGFNRKLAAKEKRLYTEMCRVHPDVVVKLLIPLEVSCRRKPCTGKEYEIVRRKVEITDVLHYQGSRELTVDSSGDLDETKREIVSLLWRYI